MSERATRILFIAFFVVFTTIVGIAIYIVFFRQAPPTEQPSEVTYPGGVLPVSDEGRPIGGPPIGEPGGLEGAQDIPGTVVPAAPGEAPRTILITDSVTQSVSPAPDGKSARYYDPIEGKFFKTTPDGLITEMSDKIFPNVEDVSWGNATDQAILKFPDGSKVHYDFTTKKQTTLPKHWDGFEFSSSDTNIVAKSDAISPESRFLIIADPNGKNPKAIESLGENASKVFPNWTPNNEIVAYSFTGEAQGFDRQQIIMVGKNKENFRGLLVEGRGFEPLWSPSGQHLIYSVWNISSDYRPELWISGGSPNTLNENRRKLELFTWAKKCAWQNESIVVCAVPEDLPRGAGMQPSLFVNIPDRIVTINIETGTVTNLGKPNGDFSVRDPVVTENGEKLIFTDAITGALYSFALL